jgi:hypothetical protein
VAWLACLNVPCECAWVWVLTPLPLTTPSLHPSSSTFFLCECHQRTPSTVICPASFFPSQASFRLQALTDRRQLRLVSGHLITNRFIFSRLIALHLTALSSPHEPLSLPVPISLFRKTRTNSPRLRKHLSRSPFSPLPRKSGPLPAYSTNFVWLGIQTQIRSVLLTIIEHLSARSERTTTNKSDELSPVDTPQLPVQPRIC